MLACEIINDNSSIKLMFVYGSLMNNFYNYERYINGLVEERVKAKVRGKLYHLSNKGYPALVDGEGFVYGELLKIKDFEQQLPRLDKLEGYVKSADSSNEYNRTPMEVEVLEGEKIKVQKAYVYKYNTDKNKIEKEDIYIPDGDWRKFMIEHIAR